MNSDSPMMRRVRADFLKTKIPRKGRIRFLLAIIILAAAIHTGINLKKNENKGQGKETPGSELTERKAEKETNKSAAGKAKRRAAKKISSVRNQLNKIKGISPVWYFHLHLEIFPI